MNYDRPPPYPGMPPDLLDELTERVASSNAWGSSAGHVYVFGAREFVKVGSAIDVPRRWRALCTANPMLEPALYVTERVPYAASVETRAHRELADHRIPGTEWFTCDRAHIIAIVMKYEQVALKRIRTSGKSPDSASQR